VTKKIPSLENLLFYLFLFFLALFPFLEGGSSPLAYSLSLQSLLILSLVFFFKKPKISSRLLLLWLLYLASQILALIFTISPARSFQAVMLNLPFFFYFLLSSTLINKKNLKYLVYTLIASAFSLSLLSFFYLLPQVKKPATTLNLVYAIWGHSHLADFLLLVLPLSLVLYLKKKKPIFLGLFLFFLVTFLLTFSRGALFVFPFSLLALLLLTKPLKKKIISLFILIPLFWLGGIFLTSKIYQLPLGKTPDNWLTRQTIKRFEFKRLEYFRQSLVIFKKHPLTGSGPNTFYLGSLRYQQTPLSWSWFSHNHFLQTLAESGLLGFLSLISLLSYLLFKNYQIVKREKNPLLTAFYSGILGSTLHSLIDFDWQFPAIFLWLLVLNGAIFSFSLKKSQKLLPFLFLAAFFSFVIGTIFLIEGNPVKQDPQNPEVYQEKAEQYEQEENLGKALENYQKAIKYNPLDKPSLYLKQAELISTPQEKIKILEDYYQLTHQYTWKDFGVKTKEISRLYFALAELYFQENDLEKAETVLTKNLNEVDNWELDYYALLKKIFTAQNKAEAYLPYAQMCHRQLPKEPRCE